jgi:putative ABC transport system permease protein
MTPLLETVRVWLGRLRRLPRLSALDRDMDDEMRHHIECEIAERMRAGESPEAARRAALVDFGGVERTKEDARDARGLRPIEDLVADARHACRVLRRSRGSTLAVMATFALGIASAGASFTLVYGVLLRPLPYADPDRLMAVWERNTLGNQDRNVVSVANFEAWQRASTSFADMAALVPNPVTLTLGSSAERVMGADVSPGYFRMLGVAPMLGRDFEASDARSAGARVVILSHDYWTRRFGADPGVVGRTLRLSDGACTIVGVMPRLFEPPRFHWLGTQEMWFPFAATPENARWGRFLLVAGRLRPDVTIARARVEMAALADRMAGESPANRGWSVTIVPLAEQITGDVSTALRTLLAAVGLLFLIAVANVTTLTATAARRRSQEMALRRSLGATDGRLFRQLFTQHTLLGLMGGAAGIAAIPASVGLMIALAPPGLPRLQSIRVDTTTLGVTIVGVGVAIAVFSGLAASRRRVRIGGGRLVACEIAVALTLGIMATLMARTIVGLRHVDLGFESDGVVAARVALAGPAAAGANATIVFDELLLRIRSTQSVEAAAIVNTRPLGGPGPATHVSDPAGASEAARSEIVTDIRYASAGLFDTLRIPLVAGHTFDAHDTATSPIAVVVSESLARTMWPGQRAVGRALRLELFNGITASVVGVAGDVHFMNARTPVRPAAYLSSARFPDGTRDILVRTTGDPAAIVPRLRAHVAALAPDVPLYQVEAMTDAVEATRAQERFTTFLLSAFAVIASVLGSVGVFGVIASEVGRRSKEIGVRMALGATRSAVSWLMLRQTIVRATVGIAAGVVLAMWLARSMETLLFGVTPLDPVSYLAAIACVIALSLIATMIPVVQALRQSPLAALREN